MTKMAKKGRADKKCKCVHARAEEHKTTNGSFEIGRGQATLRNNKHKKKTFRSGICVFN